MVFILTTSSQFRGRIHFKRSHFHSSIQTYFQMRRTILKYYLLNNNLRRLIKRIHYNIFASFITLTHSGPLKSEGLKVKAGNLIKSRGKESLEGKHANLFKRESAKGVGRLFNFRLNRRDIFVGKNG